MKSLQLISINSEHQSYALDQKWRALTVLTSEGAESQGPTVA